MPTARFGLSCSVVDGKIYAIGGAVSPTGTPLATVEAYDPATDTWSSKAPMPTARNFLTTSAVNGIIYAIGGDFAQQFTHRIVEAY
ncbi:MAG: galactose oxidase, partial [Gammaproteobacteria bacterium]|nr:galactose oxidase [Gammaproteobacteria bacterium]